MLFCLVDKILYHWANIEDFNITVLGRCSKKKPYMHQDG